MANTRKSDKLSEELQEALEEAEPLQEKEKIVSEPIKTPLFGITPFYKNKKVVTRIIGISIVALVIVFTLGYLVLKKPPAPQADIYAVCSTPQNNYLLKQAVPLFNYNSSNIVALGGIISKIEKLPNYQKDPNCDYVVLTYYIYTGNLASASIYMTRLEQSYNSKKGYSEILAPSAKSISNLKRQIAEIQQAYKQAQKNSYGIEVPSK